MGSETLEEGNSGYNIAAVEEGVFVGDGHLSRGYFALSGEGVPNWNGNVGPAKSVKVSVHMGHIQHYCQHNTKLYRYGWINPSRRRPSRIKPSSSSYWMVHRSLGGYLNGKKKRF